MTRHHDKRTGAARARWEITPHFAEQLELSKKYSRWCTPLISDVDRWQVTNRKGDATYDVNLAARTCGCRRWDVTGMPCNHALSAIIKAKQVHEDYVNPFFKKEMYVEAYKPVIYPVPGQHSWTKTDTPDIVPPMFFISKGRKQEKRRKSKFEPPKPKVTSRMGNITCSNCKLQGHKYTSCLKELRPDLLLRKNKHVVHKFLFAQIVPFAQNVSFCLLLCPPQAPRQAPQAPPRAPPQASPQPPRQAPPQPPRQWQAPRPASTRQAPPQAPPQPPRQAPRQAGEPAYKRTRTWSYFNCGYDGEAGSSNSME